MIAPNFFLVGAPKAGTTSLYRYLDRHPSVYMSPIKEPCFFAPEVIDFTPESRARYDADRAALGAYLDGPMRERRNGIVLDWEQYLKLFKHVSSETAVGEVSGNYLGSSGAPGAIKARIPHARIIMMLRDPVDRLFSHYAAARGAGDTTKSFGSWVEEHLAAETRRRPPFGPVWNGRYTDHLRRYLAHFPREQVRVYFYEDYLRDPASLVNDMFGFLGVEARAVSMADRHNVTMVPRWPRLHRVAAPVRRALRPLMPAGLARLARSWTYTRPRQRPTPEERARVIAVYEKDVLALEKLVGRDLSGWRHA